MTDNVLQPDQVLQERYRIKHLIARGGMSEVYLAVHEHTGETVVIKCLPRRLADRPDLVARFAQECRTYGKLQHPNIVRILDAGALPDGSIYIAMEKLDGRSLRALMPKGQALNPLHALDIIHQLCEALCFAHKKGILHRDIKPDNIMVGDSGHVWLLDFGLARWNTPGGLASRDMPHMGTVGYMAPEHAHDRNSVDHRADIYAVGVMLYEMLAGRNAFDPDEDATQVEVIVAHLHVEPAPLHKLDPDVPESLSNIVAKCLAKKPEDRFPTVNALALAVRAEGRRMIESGHPLAQCYLQPSDQLPALRPAMARALAKAVEMASPPQPTQELPAQTPRACDTAELPPAFTPAPATPFERAAPGPIVLSSTEQPPSSSQPAPPASVPQRMRGKGFTERILPLPGSQPPPSSQQPGSPAPALLRGKGFTERMLPLPAQSRAPQSPVPVPPQSSAPARDSAPGTRSAWMHPDQRAKDDDAPAPPRAFEPGTLSRRLLLFAPAIGLVLAALVLTFGSVLQSAWEQSPSPAAPLAPPIAPPPPAPATVAPSADPSITLAAPDAGALPSEIASASAAAQPSAALVPADTASAPASTPPVEARSRCETCICETIAAGSETQAEQAQACEGHFLRSRTMSDEDIRKYLPKPADILRRFDEDAAKRKLEEALDNPELDQALADLENQPKSPTHAGDPSRGEGPWHEAPPGVAVSPTLPPAGAARKPRTARARPRIPAVVSVLLAALAVTAPAILVAILKAPAPLDSSLRHPATAELAATNSAVPRETPGVVDAGQSGTAPAPDAGPERQTPEPAGSSSAALPATASASASPRAPPSPAAPQKRPGTSKRAPAPSIPEDILQ